MVIARMLPHTVNGGGRVGVNKKTMRAAGIVFVADAANFRGVLICDRTIRRQEEEYGPPALGGVLERTVGGAINVLQDVLIAAPGEQGESCDGGGHGADREQGSKWTKSGHRTY